MNFGLEKAAVGLPALLGVILGIWTFTGGSAWLVSCLLLILVGFGLKQFGKAMMHQWPQVGARLIEFWILAAIGAMAVATSFIIWISLNPPLEFLGDTITDAETKKAISGAFVGAVTTYVALVWTKDISAHRDIFGRARSSKTLCAKPMTTSRTNRKRVAKFTKRCSKTSSRGMGSSAGTSARGESERRYCRISSSCFGHRCMSWSTPACTSASIPR